MDNYIKLHYADEPTQAIAEHVSLSVSYIKRIAWKMGVHKSEEYIRRLRNDEMARLSSGEMLTGTATDWEHGVAPTSLWVASEDSLPPLQEDVIVYSELLSYSMRHRTDDPNAITDKYGFYLEDDSDKDIRFHSDWTNKKMI